MQIPKRWLQWLIFIGFGFVFGVSIGSGVFNILESLYSSPRLLSDPFLQLPTPDTVRVVWFTEFSGSAHRVAYGPHLEQTVAATTTQLSRSQEDRKSRVGTQTKEGQVYHQPVMRPIWRHEAIVSGLMPDYRVPYRVTSVREDGRPVRSEVFSLAPQPPPGKPLKILLTSDHQLMPMVAANLQKAFETIGRVDAVFLAGDLVNVPDRASEWFDDNRGRAFFPCLQGRAHASVEKNGRKTVYRGGAFLQHAPLFAATGNHEVMGRASTLDLNDRFNDPVPFAIAQQLYQTVAQTVNPTTNVQRREHWIEDRSFNTNTYNEIFTLPPDRPAGKNYYAVSFGDIRLIVLQATNMWRPPGLTDNTRGRYRERQRDLDNPAAWGYGQFIFEPIAKGSPQYQWLKTELTRPEFQQARYKIVMLHHPPHSLGANVVPPYTDPHQKIERDPVGTIQSIRYEYPQSEDYLIRDVVPLLESAGVQLVFYGHSHVWNRFVGPTGMHFLESSNVGNNYGAFWGEKQRSVPQNYQETYAATGNPNGLEPVVPNLSPTIDSSGKPLPYVASNDITVFSLLDTETGTVSSYAFDLRSPDAPVVALDRFTLSDRQR